MIQDVAGGVMIQDVAGGKNVVVAAFGDGREAEAGL